MTRTRLEEIEDREQLRRSLAEPRRAGSDTLQVGDPHHEAPDRPAPFETHPDDARTTIFAILGGSTRKGSWEPAEHNEVIAIMGGVNLDFREADLLEGTTTVRCFAMMGGIDIIVPPDVDVAVNGTGLLGGFDHVDHRSDERGVPRLEIEGLALMGGVSVRVKERTPPASRAPAESSESTDRDQ